MDYAQYNVLEFRRKFFKIFGAEIKVTDPAFEKTVGFIKMKAWVLREDVRLYADESKEQELLRIHARNIVDFGATYDVFDGASELPNFSLRRKGLRSTFVRDYWQVLDSSEKQIAEVRETSSGLALVRRYVGLIPFVGALADLILMIAPLTYTVSEYTDTGTGSDVANIIHRKNPFIVKMSLQRTDAESSLDARIPVAATALLSVIDASKN